MEPIDLEFKQHDCDLFDSRALISFDNGYGASIVTGFGAHSDEDHPYELAVFKGGSICYDSPMTDDVIGHLTEVELQKLLKQIQDLPRSERIEG